MAKKEGAPFGAGISSMLMLFVILCLTVFGVLAYMTARADNRLTLRSAEAVKAYYAADAEAEEILSRVDAAGEDYAAVLREEGFSTVQEGERLTADLELPIEGTRVYRMQLVFTDGEYEVTIRRMEDNTVWEEEDLNVWDGQ